MIQDSDLFRGVISASLALSLLACGLEEVDSDAIRTHGMYAEIQALAPGDQSTLVRVNLYVGGDNGTTVRLVGDDQLVARVGDVPQILTRAGSGRYEHSLTGEASGQVVVELRRGADDYSTFSVASMPEPFAMSLEGDLAAGVPRSQAAVVTWDVGGDFIDWRLEGPCIWSESGTTFDDGRFELRPALFRPRAGDAECEVSFTLDRVIEGDVDSAFIPGSTFRAVQRRRVYFLSTPAVDESAAGS